MSTARMTLPTSWGAGGRITASGATDIRIDNTSDREVGQPRPFYWAVTADDTAPAFHVSLGHKVEPGGHMAITLADTERLWLATRGGEITVTKTEG